jgi:two-component system, OmpR family, sensor histidine kinase ArlS
VNIKFKITTLFVLLVTAILLLLSFSVYYFASLERLDAFRKRLQGRATSSAQFFSLFGDNDSTRILMNQFDSALAFALPQKTVSIYDNRGQLVYNYAETPEDTLTVQPELLREVRLQKEYFFSVGERDAIGIYTNDSTESVVVIAAAYDQDGWERLSNFKDILLLSLFIGIGSTLVVGYVFSVQLVKPITQIIHEVKDISSYNLSHHIKAGTGHDELSQLANTFNDLLIRLQESFIIQRRFISNASHELSTPLASMLSQLEVTLHKDRSQEEYRQVMQSIREDVQQMRQLTKSLLEIARTGSEGSIELSEVRIDEVLFKVVAAVQKISPDYQVEFHLDEFPDDEKSFLVFGNSDLLYSSLQNIVENGCKYSPDHLSWLELKFETENVVVEVKNKGDVIAEEEIKNIFQPFYRATSSPDIKGFGLGLALARRIIHLHKGSIQVESDITTGTVFRIKLPTLRAFSRQ